MDGADPSGCRQRLRAACGERGGRRHRCRPYSQITSMRHIILCLNCISTTTSCDRGMDFRPDRLRLPARSRGCRRSWNASRQDHPESAHEVQITPARRVGVTPFATAHQILATSTMPPLTPPRSAPSTTPCTQPWRFSSSSPAGWRCTQTAGWSTASPATSRSSNPMTATPLSPHSRTRAHFCCTSTLTTWLGSRRMTPPSHLKRRSTGSTRDQHTIIVSRCPTETVSRSGGQAPDRHGRDHDK